MFSAIAALFGLIVGSFLNVVILRFGSERSWMNGRSACPSCGTSLKWYDLLPVISYLALRGRCRYCRRAVSVQYPLVEASTAALFAGVAGAGLPIVPTACSFGIVSVLICIFVYDLRYKLIPTLWSSIFIALAFILGFLTSPESATYILAAGPISALPILFLWYLSAPFTGRSGVWMGFGDVKLALGIGFLLPYATEFGFPVGLVAIFFAFVIGAVISVCILLPLPILLRLWGLRQEQETRGYTMKSEVPFGPFLIASCLMLWFAVMYHAHLPLFL